MLILCETNQPNYTFARSLSKLIFVFAVFVGAFWLEFYDAKIVSVVYYKSENMRNSSKTRLRARKSDRTSNQKSAYFWSYRYVITVIISIQFLDALHSMFDVCMVVHNPQSSKMLQFVLSNKDSGAQRGSERATEGALNKFSGPLKVSQIIICQNILYI